VVVSSSEMFIACDVLLQIFKERTSFHFLHHIFKEMGNV
jgi:hypothetical protein